MNNLECSPQVLRQNWLQLSELSYAVVFYLMRSQLNSELSIIISNEASSTPLLRKRSPLSLPLEKVQYVAIEWESTRECSIKPELGHLTSSARGERSRHEERRSERYNFYTIFWRIISFFFFLHNFMLWFFALARLSVPSTSRERARFFFFLQHQLLLRLSTLQRATEEIHINFYFLKRVHNLAAFFSPQHLFWSAFSVLLQCSLKIGNRQQRKNVYTHETRHSSLSCERGEEQQWKFDRKTFYFFAQTKSEFLNVSRTQVEFSKQHKKLCAWNPVCAFVELCNHPLVCRNEMECFSRLNRETLLLLLLCVEREGSRCMQHDFN